MADLTITAANVAPATGATIDTSHNFGATVTAGQTVYLDPATSTYKLADNNASATTALLRGVALNGGAAGQPAAVLLDGNYNPGATVAVGTIYCLSATAGAICPAADLASGNYTNVLGVATTTSNILVRVIASGVAVP